MPLTPLPQPSWQLGGRRARAKSCTAVIDTLIVMADGADFRVGGLGYPKISPITHRHVGASGDMSHSSLLLLPVMSPKLRTLKLQDILMQEDASDSAPPRLMYIDDQVQDVMDSEKAAFFAHENLAEAHDQWLRVGGPHPRIPTPPPLRGFARSPTPSVQDTWPIPLAQDMDVDDDEEEEEQEEELASELFPLDKDSDPEEEHHLPPPSSLTHIASRIRTHICKYLDDQAEDSDEEVEEQHEEDEGMKEDRDFVDDTAVHDDFATPAKYRSGAAHFQNVDKIALYERDVAREAAGEVGAPPEMLSLQELVYNKAKCLRTGLQIPEFDRQRNLEMLDNIDVKVNTWVRTPSTFHCPVGFVLTVNHLAVILDGTCKVRKQPRPMLQGWEIVLFAPSKLSGFKRYVLAKPSPALNAGDRVVVVTGESKDLFGTIGRVHNTRIANQWVSMVRVITPGSKSFNVGLAQLKRHGLDLYYNFRIHDQVCVVCRGLYVGATGRVEKIEGPFLTIAIPDDYEVVGNLAEHHLFDVYLLWQTQPFMRRNCRIHSKFAARMLTSTMIFGLIWERTSCPLPAGVQARPSPSSPLPFQHPERPDRGQHGFEGIQVMVARSEDFRVRTVACGDVKGVVNIPHKGFIGMIVGDYDSGERRKHLTEAALDSLASQPEDSNCGKQPQNQSRRGKLLKLVEPTYTCLRDHDVAGIMVTIQGAHSLETVQVPIEHVGHLRQVSFDSICFSHQFTNSQDDDTLGEGSLFAARCSVWEAGA
ncbi:hypothetical protein B0H14DRAFT_2655701 [Mycena olivaceomarginata]|nr:hypothetical protein B0H14DRAFT_2655701 [Mycena olivaceomarginata]